MNGVKLIFITLELVMITGVMMFAFLTDWVKETEAGTAWMFQTMIVLMTLCAVVFQREQQNIEWNLEEE